MAKSRLCKIPGCRKPRYKRDWCNAHYIRWRRHGDPEAGATMRCAPGEPKHYFFETVVNFTGDECLTWPHTILSNGYGQVVVDGERHLVHRLACEIVHGPAPTRSHVAAHSCGNGHFGCCNPRHVRWATRSENELDKLDHGTAMIDGRHHSAKFSPPQIVWIRNLCRTHSYREIARMFGTTHATISKIANRTNYDWVP